MMSSSTETSSMPMLMPACSGMCVAGEGLAAQGGEGGARVGEGVDAHAEGGDHEAAGDADHAEREDDQDLVELETEKESEVENDDDGDQGFQNAKEFSLGGEVGLAGLVDEFADFAHGVVDRHGAQAGKNIEAEDESEGADNETTHQKAASGDTAEEGNRVEPGQLEVGFAAPRFLGHERRAERHERKNEHQHAQD